MTANGLLKLLRVIAEGKAYGAEACGEMLKILLDQRFKSGIPAGLPQAARVAHKTGNIATVHHDAGIVYLENRKPYVLVILTQFHSESARGTAVADVSRDIYECLAAGPERRAGADVGSKNVEREFGLKVVDAFDLDAELRSLLRPGRDGREDKQGRQHRLPRYFYEVPSHEAATDIRLTPHFGLNEFLLVDLKEAPRLRNYPRYVPCAVRVLAFYLERLREAVGDAAAHRGQRRLSLARAQALRRRDARTCGARPSTSTAWAPIVLRDQDADRDVQPRGRGRCPTTVYVMPYGHEIGKADDHIHLDLGYVTVVPREISEDRLERPSRCRGSPSKSGGAGTGGAGPRIPSCPKASVSMPTRRIPNPERPVRRRFCRRDAGPIPALLRDANGSVGEAARVVIRPPLSEHTVA